MENIKVKIDLRNKINHQDIFITVPLYDIKNGLINFPIDLNEWEVLEIYRFTGLYDKNQKEVYERDRLYDKNGDEFMIVWSDNLAQFLGDYGSSDFGLTKYIIKECELI